MKTFWNVLPLKKCSNARNLFILKLARFINNLVEKNRYSLIQLIGRFGEELQTMIFKKNHENSHFLLSEFNSRCKNVFKFFEAPGFERNPRTTVHSTERVGRKNILLSRVFYIFEKSRFLLTFMQVFILFQKL